MHWLFNTSGGFIVILIGTFIAAVGLIVSLREALAFKGGRWPLALAPLPPNPIDIKPGKLYTLPCGYSFAQHSVRPLIVCLCGSGRFLATFEKAEFEETLAGKIVLTIGCNTHDVARTAELAHHKPMLDQLHLRKIELADEVLILNVNGYIGESTSRELAYARKLGKAIRFWEPAAAPREEAP